VNEDQLREWADKTNEIATELIAANPDLHPLTASVIANDLLSAQYRTEQVNAGADATHVVWLIGSYARWDWAVTMVAAGKISDDWFAENIVDLWRGSDPDDTAPQNLAIWQRMFAANGGTIRDGRPLPKGNALGLIRVFRGVTSPAGIKGFAWTTDPKTAAKFARGAGERIKVKGGAVITGYVRPTHVLAFITGRKESEVIVDPRLVTSQTIKVIEA
jgi:hypothetical protein